MKASMHSKSIIIVSAGVMQIPAILTAKSMNLNVIATDRSPDAAGFKYCDIPIVLDSKDIAGHIDFALANKDKLNIQGAFAASDVAVTVAGITQALNLPGIPMDVAIRSNNKSLMKERWLKDNIPTPFGIEVKTLKEAIQVIKIIGLPVIVKAVDNAASRGSMKIVDERQLLQALENAKLASRTGTAIIEEYVNGSEQSVESIIWKAKHYHVGMADRSFGYHPFHIETSHVDPSQLNSEVQKKIFEVVDNAADSLGIDFGPAKADMILTPKGPMILEMPARLSGGFHSQYTTPLSTGQDPIRAVIEIAMGLPLSLELLVPKFHNTSICSGIFPDTGKITSISGVEDALKIDGIAKVIINKSVGDTIDSYIDNSCRFGWIIGVGKSKDDADLKIRNAKSLINISVE